MSTIRIKEETHALIKQAAKKESRTMTAVAERMIALYLSKQVGS